MRMERSKRILSLVLALLLLTSVGAWSPGFSKKVAGQSPLANNVATGSIAGGGSTHLSRNDFIKRASSLVAFGTTTMMKPDVCNSMMTDPKTGISLPEEGEIAAAIPKDWSGVDNPLQDGDVKSLLGRLDSTPDSIFYKDPRFVEHVDDNAVQIMTRYISDVAIPNNKGDVAVLDLCSSWTSHMDSSSSTQKLSRVAGLGMNAKELSANPSLTEYVVQDLSENPKLPYENSSFDVVLLQLSIDYLTRPLEVLREAGRILKPGGKIHILFSNRLFLSKAVALWTGADDVDHAYTVGCYLYFCNGGFEDISAQDLSTHSKGRNGRIVGDPLYVVTATKS